MTRPAIQPAQQPLRRTPTQAEASALVQVAAQAALPVFRGPSISFGDR